MLGKFFILETYTICFFFLLILGHYIKNEDEIIYYNICFWYKFRASPYILLGDRNVWIKG